MEGSRVQAPATKPVGLPNRFSERKASHPKPNSALRDSHWNLAVARDTTDRKMGSGQW